MVPEIMDDWYWFLMCNWMRLFCPLDYMEEIVMIRRLKWEGKW